MRLSLVKAAHADVGGASWQEIRVAHLFRPTYAEANEGHPSNSLRFRLDGLLNRLRKNAGPGRKDVPQGLKPDVFSVIYGPTKVVP
jgi:hypothetical protein